MRIRFIFALFAVILASLSCFGQGLVTARRSASAPRPADTPQPNAAQSTGQKSEAAVASAPAALPVSAIKIHVRIDGRVATVRVEHLFKNDSDEALEGTYYFPVPEGATLLEFAVYDGDERRVGRVKEKEEARAAYSEARSQGEDPAILEMTKRGWFQSRVSPIPPHADKRVEISYSQVLSDKDGVITFDYLLGRGYKKLKVPVGSVDIDVDLHSDVAIKNLFSPTHPMDIHHDSDRHATAIATTTGGADADNFQLLYSLSDSEVGMSLITYRKKGEDGYFLLMLSPKIEFDSRRVSAKDVVFVIDISLSMEGAKIRQAKEALRFGLAHTLGEGDRFNIIAFGGEIVPFEQRLVEANSANISRALDFVDKLKLISATNINDALLAAMHSFERGTRPHNLVFITDGQPTASVSDPGQIAANARGANTANVRLFTFGVGADVNSVLLERLASENRGATTDIADESKLARTMSGFFSKVRQPVLSDLHVDFGPVVVDRVHPAELPDLYTRSQIKIFGRYRNAEDLNDVTVTLTGEMSEQSQRFEFKGLHFPLFTTDSEALPKLWATERVNALLSEIRVSGERPELKQEVIDLAREFDLVTPYTSMYVPTKNEIEREKSAAVAEAGAKGEEKDKSVEQFSRRKDPGVVAMGGLGDGSGGGAPALNKETAAASTVNVSAQVQSLPLNGREVSQLAMMAPPPSTVVDSNGAVIPNATVTIKDPNTGATRTTTTDEQGHYNVPGLQPGNYQIEVDAPGFKKAVVSEVVVQPGQTTGAGVALSPGSVSEVVTVVANAANVVDATATQMSSNQESNQIKDLPRAAPVDSLAKLAPGIAQQNGSGSSPNATPGKRTDDLELQINGGRPRSQGHRIDGHDNNNIDGRPTVSISGADSVQSLNIVTTRGPGDLSFNGAASVNIITRGGTNDFHGTVFDFHLNRGLGALSPLERRSGLDQPPKFGGDIFGGTFGGPIQRDRSFFFGSFARKSEVTWLFADSTASFLTPTQPGLDSLAATFSHSPTVADLIRRGPLAQLIGDPSVTRTFLAPVLGVPIELGEITRVVPSSGVGYEAGARFDFEITRRDRVQTSYWYDGRDISNSTGRPASGFMGDRETAGQLAMARWTRLMSPRSTNEIGFTFNRAALSLDRNQPSTGAEVQPQPSVVVGVRGLGYGGDPFLGASQRSTLFEASEALTESVGRHTVKLGGQLRRRSTQFDYLPGLGGQFRYATFDDFVSDRPAALAVAVGDPRSRFSEFAAHVYVDDSWRVLQNLTLSFGLSYEIGSQPVNQLVDRIRRRESDSARALFDTSLAVEARTPGAVGLDINNFAPRVGFAFTPRFHPFGGRLFGFEKTVIRGGAALSYDQTAYRPLADVAASSPNVLLGIITSNVPAFPIVPDAAGLRALLGGNPNDYARTALAGDYHSPAALSWHLDATRDFDSRVTFEVGYVGTRGSGLIRAIDGNPFETGGGPVRIYESSGHSIYHSVQTRADIRFTNSLTAGVAYTFSKLIDDVPGNNLTMVGGVGDPASLGVSGLQSFAQNPFDGNRGERGLSSLNRRHALSASFVWDLPLPRGQRGFVGRLLGGWKASGIIEAGSGQPYTPLQFLAGGGGSSGLFASVFSDRLGSVRPFAGNSLAPADSVAFSNASNAFFHFFTNGDGSVFVSPTGFIIADRSGFREGSVQSARFVYNDYVVEQSLRARGLAADSLGKTFAAGRPFGDVGRNTLIGPRLVNVDFAMLKTTKLSEKVSLQFRAEFFNTFNHPSRSIPNFVVENAGGRGFADLGESDATPRRIRLALKLIF